MGLPVRVCSGVGLPLQGVPEGGTSCFGSPGRGWGNPHGRNFPFRGLFVIGAHGGPAPADRLNRDSIGRIQRSLFALSLDAPVLAGAGGRGPEGGAKQVLHGGGAGANSANRWFDKTLQVGGA